MNLQKKTKVALLLLTISIIILSLVLAMLFLSDNSVETVQSEPDISVTPSPLPEPTTVIQPNDDSEEDVPEEPTGLTNKQKYYKPLVEKGSTSILLIGQDAVHHAYDTIIVLNIDESNKVMKLINFPRDAYIDYNSKILEQLKEADPEKAEDASIQKMNAAHAIAISLKYKYDTGGKFGKVTYMNFWADLLEEIFDISVDDYIIIQTDGFREIIDYFGGVEINVPMYMHYEDPLQDLYIHLEPGKQVLNGEQAEGFVRFRQGFTPEGEFKTYSVYTRQKHQNMFLKAFFEQHVNLSNLSKVGDIAKIIVKNVKTSVNSTSEILKYSNIMQKVLRGKYENQSIIVECPTNKIINGISYEILRTE